MFLLVLALQVQQASPPVCEAGWPRPTIAWDSAATRDSMIAKLREAARAAPKDGEAWLAYGLFLTVTNSEKLSDWRDRLEAQEALDQALRLLPGDPRPLAAFAVLRRKQGARIDARRLIRRAVSMVADGKGDIGHCFEAELYYQMAMVYRTWWEDWEGMTFMGFGAVGSLRPCVTRAPRPGRDAVGNSPESEEEVACPETFYDMMSRNADLTSMRYDDRDAMIEALEAAVAANPLHRDARHALLLTLYELQDWERFTRTLRAGLAVDSLDPWLPLWGATAAFAQRDIEQSGRFARDALRLLPPAERTALLSAARIAPLNMRDGWTTEDDSLYWRAADPLFLTDANERLLAQVARVTYAAGKFDVPLMGALGLDTNAGFMLVRYGRPWRRWMIPVVTGGSGLSGFDERELIWAMDSTLPPLRLDRPLTMRRWRFTPESEGRIMAYAAVVPEHWDTHEAFDIFDSLPVEVARFEDAGHTVLDVYALWRNPYTDLVPDTLHVGFFLHDAAMDALVDRRRVVAAPGERMRLQFRAPLSPALYWYRVETLTGPMRAAGRVRGGLRVAAGEPDSLRTSDLLLGRSAREPPLTIPHRDSLAIDPLYDLKLAPGDSLVVYWETYGLMPDSTRTVRYHVTVDARETDQGTLAGLIGRLGAVIGVGRRSGLTLEWDVSAAAGDAVRRDVLMVDPAGWKPGSYVLRVRITEAGSGRSAVSERRVLMEDAGS
jgi:tetratricopeptide (TPR) repeat protein